MSIASAPSAPAKTAPPASPPREWNVLPAFLSYLVPGLGQISQGRIGKGVLFFLCIYILFFYGTVLGSGTAVAVLGNGAANEPYREKRFTITSCVYLPRSVDSQNNERSNPLGLPPLLANLYNRPQFVGQFCIGIAAWPAIWQYNRPEKKDDSSDSILGNYQQAPSLMAINAVHTDNSKALELGLVFTVIAGVLNVLVIYDALAGPAMLRQQATPPRTS